ncbi:MAG: transposase [Meiothermus sp.]|uniref:transposase n=1 Tax=Meiothermus sp. TaxID=1955249 RepID=UPI00298ED256|nr:transposase [Meiothermus sp.]MDW8481304.1 transposase [Meiothermus sp.]
MSEVVQGSLSGLERWEQGYVLGLMQSEHKNPSAIAASGATGYSPSYSCRLLRQEARPHEASRGRRLSEAPQGMYLGVDLVPVAHQGCWIEGVDRVYSSSDKAPVWGHNLLSCGLVRYGKHPYPLSLEGFPTESMRSEVYPYRTPGEAMWEVVKAICKNGYSLTGVVFDNQFAGKTYLAKLHQHNLPFVARARLNQKVEHGGKQSSIRALGEHYPPGKARYYKRFGWYAKRIKITLADVGPLDVLLIWLPQQEGFQLMALFSTLDAGIQEVLAAWKARWNLEQVHRLLKQNLGLSRCLSRSYAAQLKHADLTIEALHLIRQQKHLHPELSWRAAQHKAAKNLKSQLLTEHSSLSA